jgi:hypothetical protein
VGIRETLNQNQNITTGVTVAIILAAIGVIVYQLMPSGPGRAGVGEWYYSTNDDGSGYFSDRADRIAPFDKGGKPAYRVFVWSCDGGKTKFVSHLERYTDDAKKKIETYRNNVTSGKPSEPNFDIDQVEMQGKEVKPAKAGTQWVAVNKPEAEKIQTPVCPGGSGQPELQFP